MRECATNFYRLWGEISDLTAVEELLAWDQETYMPAHGVRGRSEVFGTIARLRHQALVSAAFSDAVDACKELLEQDEDTGKLANDLRVAERQLGRAKRVPGELASALAIAASRGTSAWQESRASDDFSSFQAAFTEILKLKRQLAECLHDSAAEDNRRELYDELLEDYEPGLECSMLEPLFQTLSTELSKIVEAVRECGVAVDESPARGHFPRERLLAFSRWLCAELGFDFQRGRIDSSAHPFCLGLNRDDVRFTWRHDEADFRSGLLAILHELGHGLYEQGLPSDRQRTPSGGYASLGIHESQSRFWENQIGRRLGFWRAVLPEFRRALGTGPETAEQLWPSLHTIVPTLIRVEADETTYNLHIAIRFELERALLSGDLAIADLPTAWNDAYRGVLGLTPANLAEGVLQDIHWSQGLFGYFPTYTLGSLISSQLRVALEDEHGDLDALCEGSEFATILGFMRDRVHCQGAILDGPQLVRSATGNPLSAEPFLAEVKDRAEVLYGVAS